VPVDRLPALAAIIEEVGRNDVASVVIRSPLVHAKQTSFGDSQAPDLTAIRAMAAKLFSAPGTAPASWPTPKPTKAPRATAVPKATSAP
jgi:hypothetical protein